MTRLILPAYIGLILMMSASGGQTNQTGDTPMTLKIMGTSKCDALFIILHDPALPYTTHVDWQPKGTCEK
jgi:hypothetical protein